MSRHGHGVLLLMIALAGLLSLGAQSSCNGSMPLKRAGEPCTRTSECESNLVCTSGVCVAQGDASVGAD